MLYRICDRCNQSRPLDEFEYATRSDKYYVTCEGCRKSPLPRTSQGVVCAQCGEFYAAPPQTLCPVCRDKVLTQSAWGKAKRLGEVQ